MQEINYTLTDFDISKLCQHLKFEKMQKNPAVNLEPILFKDESMKTEQYEKVKFIRKGQVGDWKNYLSEDLSTRFDAWTEEHFGGTGIEFEFE